MRRDRVIVVCKERAHLTPNTRKLPGAVDDPKLLMTLSSQQWVILLQTQSSIMTDLSAEPFADMTDHICWQDPCRAGI